ncbi:MAG: DNA polymerase III subunit epsilon [Nitratireductor sp.]
MREIVFDTETTGLKPEDGERVIEIGAVELENRFPTGRSFHVYINPQGREVHPEALRVHGITNQFLDDKPTFPEIVEDFLQFIGDGALVAHNASFDMNFINSEFARIGLSAFPAERVIDTLVLARRKHPMGPNSLDALCSRYNVDNAHRTRHGALLDSELLAEVYIEMNGGRQATLLLDAEQRQAGERSTETTMNFERQNREKALPSRLGEADISLHRSFIASLGDKAIWKEWLPE